MPCIRFKFKIGKGCEKRKGCKAWKGKSWSSAGFHELKKKPELPFYKGCTCDVTLTGKCHLCGIPASGYKGMMVDINADSNVTQLRVDITICEQCIMLLHSFMQRIAQNGMLQAIIQKCGVVPEQPGKIILPGKFN